MYRLMLVLCLCPAFTAMAEEEGFGHMGDMHLDDPLLWLVRAHELELRDARGGAALNWDGEAWLGYDLHKLWLKTEGHREEREFKPEVQALYSRAIAPWWDLQAGWRRDLGDGPDRDWAVVGLRGIAPWFFEADTALFIGESGRVSLRIDVEYELRLTRRLILTPGLEFDVYSEDDRRRGIGSGFSELETGLRLRYEFRREFAPYVGLSWTRRLGGTADLARAAGEPVDDLQGVLGVRFWF